MILQLILALIRGILKLIAVPFLWIWWLISWVFVILATPFVLLIELIISIKRGDWK